MTIDEAIEMFNKKSEEYNEDFESCKERVLYTCKGCANCFPKTCDELEKEYKQLAEQLEELKAYRENSNGYNKEDIELNRNAMYNKAIDDFVKFASDMPTVETEDGEIRPMWLEEIAEQLKEGGENEN